MRIVALIAASCLLGVWITSAQGKLYVSNMEQTPTGSAAVGSDNWIAQTFRIERTTIQYTLDSIDLLLNSATGSANGFEVSLYTVPVDVSPVAPQDYIGSLSGPENPSEGGVYSYGASGIVLSPGTNYWVVLSSSTPIAEGAYHWSASDDVTQNGNWFIRNTYFTSSDGSSWERHVREEVFQMGIYATIVPEATTGALVVLGLAALGSWHRRW